MNKSFDNLSIDQLELSEQELGFVDFAATPTIWFLTTIFK